MDVEGLDGLKKGNSEENMNTLDKLSTATMLLSSVFFLMSDLRISNTIYESLKQAINVLSQQLYIQIPKIVIVPKDT